MSNLFKFYQLIGPCDGIENDPAECFPINLPVTTDYGVAPFRLNQSNNFRVLQDLVSDSICIQPIGSAKYF